MGFFRLVFIAAFLVALASCAPADEKVDKPAAAVESKDVETPAAKKSSTDERGVGVVDQSWETLLSPTTWNVLGGALGTVLLVGGVGLAYYYFYFLNYYSADVQTGYPYQYQTNAVGTPTTYNQNQQYYPVARSLDTGSSWNWPQVLYMISLAQESYEKFDFQTLDCQKKALCELTQKQNDFGETGRKVSSTFSLLDAVEGLPMPTIILTYLKEYREAINQGRNSNKECGTIYPKCNFSLKEVFVKYQKRAAGEKF